MQRKPPEKAKKRNKELADLSATVKALETEYIIAHKGNYENKRIWVPTFGIGCS